MISNRKHPHNNMGKNERGQLDILTQYAADAIAYAERQPATAANVKCRKQLAAIRDYLKAANH